MTRTIFRMRHTKIRFKTEKYRRKQFLQHSFTPPHPLTDMTPTLPVWFNPEASSTQAVSEGVTISVIFNYPLKKPVVERYLGPLTCSELHSKIMETYARIYREEDETMPAGPHSTYILNRNTTNGIHGIWGHTLEQLLVWGMIPVSTAKGRLYTLGVDS